jgi:hypothetical protein
MQQPDNSRLEDRLRDELKEASFLPPPAAWNRIEAALPGNKPWYAQHRWSLSAAVLLVAFISSYWFHEAFMNQIYPTGEQAAKSEESLHLAVQRNNRIETVQVNDFSESSLTAEDPQMTASTNKLRSQKRSVKVLEKSPIGQTENTSSINTSSRNSVLVADKKKKRQTAASQTNVVVERDLIQNSTSTDGKVSMNGTNAFESIELTKAASLTDAATGYIPQLIELQQLDYADDEIQATLKQPVPSKKDKRRQDMKSMKGFFMGPGFGMNYNLMSKAPIDRDADFSSLSYRPHFGSTFGLTFGYDFSSRLGFMMDWVYSSDEGQRFAQVVDGEPVNLSIELDYMKFPVVLKYKHRFLSQTGKNPVTLNFVGGFHYSVLRSRNTFVNGELSYFDQKHNQHQWGLVAGTEVDIYAGRQLFFTLGARMGFNAGTEGFPRMKGAEGNNPLAFQTGAFARLNYRFNRPSNTASVKPSFE